MDQLIALFPERIAYAISNTVLHSLWQITIISIGFLAVIKFRKNSNSTFRYNTALFALFLSLVSTIASFFYFYISSAGQFDPIGITAINTIAFSATLTDNGSFSIESFLMKYQSSIAALWLSGTVLLLVKFITGILNITNLRNSAIPNSDKRLNYLANTISSKLKINRFVEIKESALISTPMVIGHIKPIILFPIAVSTQLTMNEIESILTHELAHILRNDFVMNLLQSLTEVLLYFHPCIWWLSSIIREERENCCDDIALNLVEDNLTYAKSLVKLQELQLHIVPQFALAFSGSKHQLKNRIMRILNQTNPSNFLREKLVAIALLFTFVLAFANNSNTELLSIDEDANCELEDVLAQEEFANYNYSIVLEDDTIPEKNALIIKKKNKSERIDVKMEDGVITELRVDGEVIPKDRYDEFSDRIEIDKTSGIRVTQSLFDIDDENPHSKRSIIISDGDKLIEFDKSMDIDSFLNINEKNMEEALAKALDLGESFGNIHMFSTDSSMHIGTQRFEDAFAQIHKLDDFQLPEHMEHFNFKELLEGKFPLSNERNSFRHFNFESPNGLPPNGYDHLPLSSSSNNLKSKITRELANDDFLMTGKNKIELSGKQMKINGEKQPRNIWNKYKRVYEKYLGAELNKDSKIVFEIDFDYKEHRFFKSI